MDHRRHAIPANLVGVAGGVMLAVQLKHIAAVSFIIVNDILQHSMDRRRKIVCHHQIFHAGNQPLFHGQVCLCIAQLGQIGIHIAGNFHVAGAAVVVDHAVVQQQTFAIGKIPHPAVAMPLALQKQIVGAKITGGSLAV